MDESALQRPDHPRQLLKHVPEKHVPVVWQRVDEEDK